MPDFQKLQETKRKIIESIKKNGPSLPTKIAREEELSPLFISAFLSEIVSEKKLKITNMKVGSSPVYYIEGQESQLENFTEHLNTKEREAFLALKEFKILEDQEQLPAIRVALRKIKDFAIPAQVKIEGGSKLFWKFFLLSSEDTKNLISGKLLNSAQDSPKEKEILKSEKEEKISEFQEKPEKIQFPKKEEKEQIKREKKFETDLGIFENEQQTSQPISDFSKVVKKFLSDNQIELIKEISSKKKEFISKVRIPTIFGNQDFYLISKDKKKVSENDISLALQKSQVEKMPALIISPGELDKKAYTYIQEWKNLVKFRKLP